MRVIGIRLAVFTATVAFVYTVAARDFSPTGGEPLFRLSFCRPGDFFATNTVTAADAKSFQREELPSGGIRLVYGDVGPAEKVVCVVRRDGDKNRWRIAVTMRTGWTLYETEFPRIPVATRADALGGGDSLLVGSGKGGVVRNASGTMKPDEERCFRSPGYLAAQFACYYNDDSLFYFATEDAHGNSKTISAKRTADGFLLSSTRSGWSTGGEAADYDVVSATLPRRDAMPCDWRDAADLYREWAERQPWCAAKYLDRTDVPEWMKAAPVFTGIVRGWLERPQSVRAWLDALRKMIGPDAPVVASVWGWEKVGDFIGPDYFPCHPDDETFGSVVAALRSGGAHAFPWPSGYNWTLSYDKQKDGSFRHENFADFESRARPHALIARDGSLGAHYKAFWLKGGEKAMLCGGDEWTRRFFNEEVALPLARLGCDMLQVDQVVGGSYPPCWSRSHGHAPGEGKWKCATFREQMATLRDTMRRAGIAQPVLTCEEPCEVFNDLFGIQDYRDCETKNEIASVFNYVYHEYLPVFQSNLSRSSPPKWFLHCAVDGQMPYFRPTGLNNDGGLGVETKLWYWQFLNRWISLYRGEGRKFLAHGRHVRPPVAAWADGEGGELHCAAYRAADGSRAVVLGAMLEDRRRTVVLSTPDGLRGEVAVDPGMQLVLAQWEKVFRSGQQTGINQQNTRKETMQ